MSTLTTKKIHTTWTRLTVTGFKSDWQKKLAISI
jgi:hypothetical protein